MNKDEFIFCGKTYFAVDAKSCNNCSLRNYDCYYLQRMGKITMCSQKERNDGKNVIFLEKHGLQ